MIFISLLVVCCRLTSSATSTIQSNAFEHYEKILFTHSVQEAETLQRVHPGRIILIKIVQNRLFIELTVFDKVLSLIAHRDEQFSNDNAVVEIYRGGKIITSKVRDIPGINYYRGSVRRLGDLKVIGTVYGSITDDVFSGKIILPNDTFYIEPSKKYGCNKSCWYNAVVYKASDMVFDQFIQKLCSNEKDPEKCLHLDPALSLGSKISFQALAPPNLKLMRKGKAFRKKNRTRSERQWWWGWQNWFGQEEDEESLPEPNGQRVCDMQLFADPTFVKAVGSSNAAVNKMKTHLYEASEQVFRTSDFNRDGAADNIGLRAVKYSLLEEQHKNVQIQDDSTQYLIEIGGMQITDYCLVMTFTNINLKPGGTIGVAFRGRENPRSVPGGICDTRLVQLSGNSDSIAMNVALISMNKNGPLSDVQVTLTVAHEAGHSFGSPHDEEDSSCFPGRHSEEGNFLMAPILNKGDKQNHFTFSSCSLEYIGPVVDSKGTCLTATETADQSWHGDYREAEYGKVQTQAPGASQKPAVCGNSVVESGEDCDCGSAKRCAQNDPCCTPPGGDGQDKGCTLRVSSKAAECSQQQGSCCGTSSGKDACKLAAAGAPCGLMNAAGGDCRDASVCDGLSPKCPTQGSPLADGTACNGTSQTCSGGKCASNVCLDNNYQLCLCQKIDFACEVCCKTSDTACLPASQLNFRVTVAGETSSKKAIMPQGVHCMDKQHMCNFEGQCVPVHDKSLSLDTTKNEEAQDKLRGALLWLANHWMYGIMVVLSMAVIVGVVLGTGKFGQRRLETKEFQKELKKARDKVHKNFPEFKNGTKKTSVHRLLCRLLVMFPSAPLPTLKKCAERNNSEEDAIKMLLSKGYKMRKI